jgi:hypothetical protein
VRQIRLREKATRWAIGRKKKNESAEVSGANANSSISFTIGDRLSGADFLNNRQNSGIFERLLKIAGRATESASP